MSKRTYYVVEMGAASYPVNEMHAQTRPFSDPQTQAHCTKVRADSKAEAEEFVRSQLSSAREEALRAE